MAFIYKYISPFFFKVFFFVCSLFFFFFWIFFINKTKNSVISLKIKQNNDQSLNLIIKQKTYKLGNASSTLTLISIFKKAHIHIHTHIDFYIYSSTLLLFFYYYYLLYIILFSFCCLSFCCCWLGKKKI